MSHTLEQQAGPALSPLAGKPAPKEMLVDLARLEKGITWSASLT
jgi:hypothetical protein